MELEKELVQQITELQKKLSTEFATKADVDSFAKALEKLQAQKNAETRKAQKHALFGDQYTFDTVAGHLGKALLDAGKIQKGDPRASFWLEKAANLNSTDAGAGTELLPVTIDPVMQKLVEDWGIARRDCRVVPAVRGTFSIKRRNVRVTVSGQTRPDDAASPAGSTMEEVDMATKSVNAITTIEEKLIFESPIDVVNEAISDLVEAAANAEDSALFVGGGTAADFGFTGLKTATGLGEVSVAVGSYTLDSVINLRTKVNTSILKSPNRKLYCHPYQFAWLQTLKASTSGIYHFDVTAGEFNVAGDRVEFTPAMDSTYVATKIPFILADLKKAVTVGLGRNTEIRILNELYAANGEIGVRMTYDLGMALVLPTAAARVKLTA